MDEGCWWERKSLKLLLLLLLPCSVANTPGSFLIRVWCTVFLTSFTHTHILDSMLKPFLISHNHYSNKHNRFCGTKSRSSAYVFIEKNRRQSRFCRENRPYRYLYATNSPFSVFTFSASHHQPITISLSVFTQQFLAGQLSSLSYSNHQLITSI